MKLTVLRKWEWSEGKDFERGLIVEGDDTVEGVILLDIRLGSLINVPNVTHGFKSGKSRWLQRHWRSPVHPSTAAEESQFPIFMERDGKILSAI